MAQHCVVFVFYLSSDTLSPSPLAGDVVVAWFSCFPSTHSSPDPTPFAGDQDVFFGGWLSSSDSRLRISSFPFLAFFAAS